MLPQGKTKRDDIEIKKLEMLNSILIKELRGYKLKIIELQDENENLQAENSKLKNSFECCGRIENLEIEHIKDDQVNDQDHEGNMVYEGQKGYKCKSCGKSFSQADDLRKHIPMVHEDHKDHKCESCGKLFSQTGDLKKHINTIHGEDKDYKYESCGKSFLDEQSLKKHTHTIHDKEGMPETQSSSVEKFKCEICQHNLSSKRNLKVHIENIHEGLKRFKCEKCSQKEKH